MGITAVSINCGAGATDMGFERAGFNIVAALCKRKPESATYEAWSGRRPVLVPGRDMESFDPREFPAADVAICNLQEVKFDAASRGATECKVGFSGMEYDFLKKYLKRHAPLAFVAFGPEKAVFDGLDAFALRDFPEYDTYAGGFDAFDYMVAQTRHVAVIVGTRCGSGLGRFMPPDSSRTRLGMADVLDGVPMPGQGDVCMKAFSRAYLRKDRRRDMDDPSLPIPVCGGNMPLYPGSPRMVEQADGSWLPGPNGTSRRLSWQEAAAIQGFPAGMEFHGGLQFKYAQIGRSVPVRFAEAMARQLGEMFDA